MTFKVVNISDPGTATRHGADDQDKIAKYLNGVDLIDPVIIDTDTILKSNRLIFRDLSDTYNINIITSAETQSGSITIPTLDGNVTMLLDNDTRLYNSRDPNLHALTHESGQPDELALDALGPTTDTTILDATGNAHGLLPKLSVDGLTYLDGNGNWTSPSGTGVLPDGSLTNAKLADETVTATKMAPGTITDTQIAPAAAIAKTKLGALSIIDADVAAGAAIAWGKVSKTGSILADIGDMNFTGRVDGDLIKWNSATSKWVSFTPSSGGGAVIPDDNSVSTIKIQNLAVTTAKLADGNVTLAKLASNSVDSSKIVDGSILNADINTSAAIAWTKVNKSGSVLGDLGNTSVSSPITGQVLTYNGSLWVPQTPSSATANDSANPVNPNVKTGWIMGGFGSLNDGECGGGMLEHTQAINICNAGQDSSGSYTNLTTTSTSQTNAQLSSIDDLAPFSPALNPKLYIRFKMPTAANYRMYIGFTDATPVSTVTYNSLDNNVGMGLSFDTTNDTHFIVLNNNGGSTATSTITSIVPGSGTLYDLSIECVSGGTWTLKLNGTTLRSTSTNVPTTSHGWGAMVNTHTSGVRNLYIYYVRAVQDG